ncbi:hypothetical protein DRQ07_12410, partial [candidate division KSB1 bacterium]
TIYAGGTFTIAGSAGASRIAQWSGSSWSGITSTDDFGINGTVTAIAKYGSYTYAGGAFSTAGSVVANNIARWDGSEWTTLGSGLTNGSVNTMITDDSGNLYVGGSFTEAGGNGSIQFLAKWDGSSWSSVGGGVNNTVTNLIFFNDDLYVAGYFDQVGAGESILLLAKWDGSNWSSPDQGVDNIIYSMQVKEDTLFVGGEFTSAGGHPDIRFIAKYSGSAWFKVGGGVDAPVSALSATGSYLYVAGAFSNAGGVSAPHVALWNGQSWSAMGTGTSGEIKSLAASGNTCYAGGTFSSIGSVTTDNIAKSNGSSWEALGDGTNGVVNSLCLGSLLVGGGFATAGSKPSSNIAKWNAESFSVRVQVKVFLEGPYDTVSGQMKTSLYSAGIIPLTSPYSEDPRTVGSIPADIVDWVLVSLRVTADGAPVAYKSAFLRNDGCIVADDGTTEYITLNAAEGTYYVVIKHRNHLDVMSNTAQSLSASSSTLFNFTTDGTRYYLSDGTVPSDAAINLSDNKWAMYAGDADGNGFITADDLNNQWRPNNGTYGYKNSDMNMDTYINAHDKNRILKKNSGKSSQVK